MREEGLEAETPTLAWGSDWHTATLVQLERVPRVRDEDRREGKGRRWEPRARANRGSRGHPPLGLPKCSDSVPPHTLGQQQPQISTFK